MRSIFLFLIVASVISSLQSFAQEAPAKYSVKLYGNLKLHTRTLVDIPDTTQRLWSIHTGVSPAFVIYRANGNFHELELKSAFFGSSTQERVTSGNRIFEKFNYINFSLNYEYNLLLFSRVQERPLRAYIGGGINPTFSYYTHFPVSSLQYPVSSNTLSTNFYIIPRLQYDISDRLFLDLNIPINLGNITWGKTRVDNPAWPAAQRTSSYIDSKLLPSEFMIRLGIGVKL